MSYRELRNFAEIMRTLGYKRVISLENFRKPNFELVADTLYHMVKLYEPETTIRLEIDEEDDRVEFLTSIATFLAAKARLRLNTKKLYASDGKAVQELLKFATLLFKATRTASKSSLEETIPQPIKVQEVKDVRQLATEITKSGAKLSDLLQNESLNKSDRLRALRYLDQMGSATEGSREFNLIERSIREQIETTRESVEDLRKESESLEADERNLTNKIKKKEEEVTRNEKRLSQLEGTKPQFMEEVEKLEGELRFQYDLYMEKYRNLDYLEHELEKYYKQEDERKQQHDKRLERMRQRLNKEQLELFQGKGGELDEDRKYAVKLQSANSGGGKEGGRDQKGAGRPNVQGSMRHEESSGGSEDLSGGGSQGGGSDEEELSVNDRRGNGPRKGPGGQGGHGGHPGQQAGRGGSGGGGAGSGGKNRSVNDDDDEFVDDEDEEDDDDDGEDGSGDDDEDDDEENDF